MTFAPRLLPVAAQELCSKLQAPARLTAHLTLVHDAAVEIVDGLRLRFPTLSFDSESVLFGAATHDLGKVLHPDELVGPGRRHESDGPGLLESEGVAPELARFARSHAAWAVESLAIEDLLVALADCVWKGKRMEDLESQVAAQIGSKTGGESWEVFEKLDGLLEEIAESSDERLAWQRGN